MPFLDSSQIPPFLVHFPFWVIYTGERKSLFGFLQMLIGRSTAQTNASDTGNDNIDFPTYLTLRTVRLDDFQSAAEVENEQKNLKHASMRMRARVVGDEGAVAGFFTFFDDDNESDIEILTDDPDAVIRYVAAPLFFARDPPC